MPASFHVLVNELKGLSLDVELKGVESVPEEIEEKEIKTKSRQKERFEEYIEAE